MPLATLMAENVFDGLDYQLVCDPGSRALIVLDSIEYAKRLGVYFSISGSISIPSLTSAYFLCRVNSHHRVIVGVMSISTTGGPLDTGLYESPTITDPGTSITPINVNRTAGPSNIQVFGGPAVTSDGTRIMYSLVPAGHKDSSSGGDSFSGIILAQDTDYVFKVTNTGNNTATVSYNFEWIEEPV